MQESKELVNHTLLNLIKEQRKHRLVEIVILTVVGGLLGLLIAWLQQQAYVSPYIVQIILISIISTTLGYGIYCYYLFCKTSIEEIEEDEHKSYTPK